MKLFLEHLLIFVALTLSLGSSLMEGEETHLRGGTRSLLEEDKSGDSWRARVKEKGEALFAEKKRAAIRAACYKDWKPGCRRIVEWAKKTGRIKGSEQQELIEFAKKILANAEENGDLIRPVGGDEVEEEPQTERPRSDKQPSNAMAFDTDQIE